MTNNLSEVDIIQEIIAAFPVGEPPATNEISDRPEQKLFFGGRNWTELNIELFMTLGKKLGNFRDYLVALTTAAQFYYLPGYMIMCLRDNPNEIDFIQLSLLGVLTPPECEEAIGYSNRRFDELAEKLTPAMRKATAHFIQHQITHFCSERQPIENPTAREIFDTYWHQFA